MLARVIDWIIVWLLALPLTGYFLYRAGADLTPAFEDYFRRIESGNTSAVPPTVTPEMLKWVIAYSVILTLVAMAYEVFFTTRTGATPGKKALGLRVRLRERPGPLSLPDCPDAHPDPHRRQPVLEPAHREHLRLAAAAGRLAAAPGQ